MAEVVVKGVRQTDGRKVRVSASDDATRSDGSSLIEGELGVANGIATLNVSSLVVQDPASASEAAAASTIAKRDSNGDVIVPATPTAANGATSKTYVDGGAAGALPRWVKYTVDETAFTAAATTEDIELFSLVAGGVIHAVKIKHSTAFSGGSLASFTVSVGISGTLAKYATAFDVFQAVADTTLQLTSSLGTEDHGSSTSIRLAAVATGDDVLNATAGSVDVWVLQSVVV